MRLILAALPLVAACGMMESSRERAEVAPAPAPAAAPAYAPHSATGFVQTVDPVVREMVVQLDNGVVVGFQPGGGPVDVTSFQPGDRVRVDYVDAVVARMSEPGLPASSVGASPAAPDARAMMAQLVSYDRADGVAVIRGADGALMTVLVPEDLRSFAAARRPGDPVAMTVTDPRAVSVQPAAS